MVLDYNKSTTSRGSVIVEIKKELHHIHDKSYKSFFENKEIFLELLQSFIKEKWTAELKKENLVQDSTKYIIRDYEEMEADIVYTATIDNQEVIFIMLLEFQSSVDHTMPIRLFWYMSEIWRKYIKQYSQKEIKKSDFKLPAIVPMVLYNGANKWTVPLEFKDKLQQADLFGSHAMNFEYILVDVNSYTKETLVQIENVVSAIFLLDQKIDSIEFVKRAAIVAKEFDNIQIEHKLKLTDWLDYTIAEPIREAVLEMFKSKLSREEVDEMTANITITLQEEKAEAIKEGIKEGIKEEKYNLAQKLLDVLDNETIADKTGLPIEEVIQLRNNSKL